MRTQPESLLVGWKGFSKQIQVAGHDANTNIPYPRKQPHVALRACLS